MKIRVFKVKSRSSRKIYKVLRHANGNFACPCLAYRFAKGHVGSKTKTCFHIDSVR